MVIIANIVKDMNCLIDKAEHYLDKAIEYNDTYPELADSYYSVYECSLENINTLHDDVVDFIEKESKNRNIKSEILNVMNQVWSFAHLSIMDRMSYIENKAKKYKAK